MSKKCVQLLFFDAEWYFHVETIQYLEKAQVYSTLRVFI